MSKVSTVYVCASCGAEYSSWQGKCSGCGEWNSVKEFKQGKSSSPVRGNLAWVESVEVQKIDEVKIAPNSERLKIGSEIDRVLGGGLMSSSVTLLAGEPGIGKSTILMQAAYKLSKLGKVQYISGEESASQIADRAKRLGAISGNIELAVTSDVEEILKIISSSDARSIIIDSVQTLYLPSLPSAPGSITQVRESVATLVKAIKAKETPLILVSHVNKEGNLAGPKTLEHMVDTVLYLEGEKFSDLRMLRGVKNRFGPTDEVGVFEMTGGGLAAVSNPSELFLKEKSNMPGSVISCVMEGTRPFLVEIQALANKTQYGYPKRRAIGLAEERLDMILAVLERRAKINTAEFDIYCSLAGGISTKDPAVDLGIALAVVSAIYNKAISDKAVFLGEIGLTGDIRTVRLLKKREKEVARLGLSLELLKNIKDLKSLF